MAEKKRFFRVMMSNFQSQLPLPAAFCRQLNEEDILNRGAVVRGSETENEWRIKVGKSSDGLLRFEDGWDDFVKHNGLNLGEFVVFEHNGDLVFDAIVFDSSANEKEPPGFINLSSKKAGEKKKKKLSEDKVERHHHRGVHVKGKNPLEVAKCYTTNSPHFVTTISASNGPGGISYMHIPSEFARSQKLEEASIIVLRDSSGKLWPVKLYTRDSKNGEYMSKRTSMRKGWLDFYTGNKLKKGDVCLFEVDNTRKTSVTLMDVHIFPLVL